MALPATDAFTGTNSTQLTTYSANWTLNSGDFDIQTNAIAADSAGNECGAHWNADAFNNNQYSQGVISAVGGGGASAVGPAVRCHASAATYYGYYGDSTAGGGANFLFKIVAGVWTQLGSTNNTPWSVNDVIRLEANGTTITPKINGTTDPVIGAQTDSAIASGSAGLTGFDDNVNQRIDTWEGGNLTTPANPPRRAHSIPLTVLAM